jgi:putative endonuclease
VNFTSLPPTTRWLWPTPARFAADRALGDLEVAAASTSRRLDIASQRERGDARGMTNPRQALGRAAEEAAARFLERSGLVVTERNVRFAEGEIDLVCRDEGVLVFVEVKCRRVGWDEAPAAAVSWRKQRRLTRLAQHYLKRTRLDGVPCRFDVVSVTVGGRGAFDVRHIRSAFDAAGD